MIINGTEILIKPGQVESIQTDINKAIDLKSDLKSEMKPMRGDEGSADLSQLNSSFGIFENDFDSESGKRRINYSYYREMDMTEFIHRALEIVADDSSQFNPAGNSIKIFSGDEDIRVKLEELFVKKLDMNNELWSILFETCKMGDNFYEVVVNDYKNPKNVIYLRFLEPDKVERIEVNGRLSHFTYKTKNVEDVKDGTNKSGEEVVYKLQPWQIIHFKLENKGFAPYGASLLYPGLKTFRRLNLLEDVMIVYRLARAPERRVFYIDVGNLNKIEAKRFLEKVKNSYRSTSFIDENGNINKKARMLSITNDIFVPMREGQTGTRIDTLQGGEALHNIDDMKYFRDKILKTMNIPPAYMGDESDRSKGSLSQLDIKFSRFIERIQNQIIQGLNKIAALELFFAGYKKEKLNDFEIELTPPSNIKEVTEIELMNQKMALLASIQQLNLFDNRWMLKNILKMSDAEIANIELYKKLQGEQPQPGMEGGIPPEGGEIPMDVAAGEEVPVGVEGEIPAEPAGTVPAAPEELAASTMINKLGKDFILENKKDFFKILKHINKVNEEKPIKNVGEWNSLVESLGEIFVAKESEPNTNNVTRQLIINELGGLIFEKKDTNSRSVMLWEGYKEEVNGKEVKRFKNKSIVLQ